MRTELNSARQVSDQQNGSGGLLQTLGDRVNRALYLNVNEQKNSISPEAVKSFISNISGQPLPGMNQNTIV